MLEVFLGLKAHSTPTLSVKSGDRWISSEGKKSNGISIKGVFLRIFKSQVVTQSL